MPTESARIIAGLTAMHAIAETIRDASPLPSGHLYAQLVGMTDLAGYNKAIGMLEHAGMVRRDRSHLLHWIGTDAHLTNLQRVIDNLTAKYAHEWQHVTA